MAHCATASVAYEHARALFVKTRILQEYGSLPDLTWMRIIAQYLAYVDWVSVLARSANAPRSAPSVALSEDETRLLCAAVDALNDEYDTLLTEWVTAYDDDERATVSAVTTCSYNEAIELLVESCSGESDSSMIP